MMSGWTGKRLLGNGKTSGAFLLLWPGLRVGGPMRQTFTRTSTESTVFEHIGIK